MCIHIKLRCLILQEEDSTYFLSGKTSASVSRKSNVSAVTVTKSDPEPMEHIEGGPRNRQSRLSLTVDIKLSKGIQQVAFSCGLVPPLLMSITCVIGSCVTKNAFPL